MNPTRVAPLFLVAAACVPTAEPESAAPAEVVQPVRATPAPVPTPTPSPSTAAAPAPLFTFDGELEQGGWIRGRVPAGTVEAALGEEPLSLDEDGRFFAAFDRDANPAATLRATLADGRTVTSPLAIAPRAWDIERVNVARRAGGSRRWRR